MKLGCVGALLTTDGPFMCSEIIAVYSDSRVRSHRFGGWHGLGR